MAEVSTSRNTADTLPTDISDHTLIGLLQASVDRLKTNVDDQRVGSELREREDRRTAIMLKLAQEQVERGRDSYAKLHKELDAAKARASSAEDEASALRVAVEGLEQSARVAAAKGDRAVQDVGVQLKAERGERAALQQLVDRLRGELQEAKEAAVTDSNTRETKFRDLYQEHATLKARCETQRDEIDFLEAQRSKEVRLVAEREYELNRAVAKLKTELGDRDLELSTLKRSSFQTTTTLNSDAEQLRIKVIQLEGMLKATDRDGASRIQQLREEVRLLQDRNEQDHATAVAREKALQQETATLTAHLRAAQKEINELSDRDAEDKRKSLTDVVQLHAERDSLAMRVASLERSLQEMTAKLNTQAVTLRTDVDVARNEKVLADQKHATELALKRDENAKLRDELSLGAQQLADAQAYAKREEAELSERIYSQDQEIRKQRVEIAGYKETVEKLDKHVRDNYAVRILEDEVSSLKQQNLQLKNQLTHANSALANLRVEADITETSRMKTMQEQVLEAQRRVAILERELRFSRPLLTDLVEAAQHGNCLDAALERDVDLFFRQFGSAIPA